MLTLKRHRGEAGWVAFAPLNGQLHVVHVVRRDGQRPSVSWASAASWADPVSALRGLRRSRSLDSSRKVVLLERPQYQLLPMNAPDVPRDDWRDALRWSLRDMVDFAMEDAGLALLEVPIDPARPRHRTVVAIAVPHAQLAPLAALAGDAGLPWQAIDVPETALRNIAALIDAPGRAQPLLHVGATYSTLVITSQGDLLMTRYIDVGLGELATTDNDTRTRASERACLELLRTLDSAERLFSHLRLGTVLVCPGVPLEAFMAYARELVQVPVAGLDLAALVDLSAVPEIADTAEQGAWLPAIGAALRCD